MNVRIQLDTPTGESLRYLLEEMVSDPFVGRVKAPSDKAWVDGQVAWIDERRQNDIPSVVAYHGSGIVGIAFSRPLGNQSKVANMKEPNDYWKMGNFYVLKAYRGQGIGKKALTYFLGVKERKVFYYADRENGASNHVARSCGLFWLHDFFTPKWADRYETCAKDTLVRSPATYFRVYCGLVPPKELLLETRLADKTLYENGK